MHKLSLGRSNEFMLRRSQVEDLFLMFNLWCSIDTSSLDALRVEGQTCFSELALTCSKPSWKYSTAIYCNGSILFHLKEMKASIKCRFLIKPQQLLVLIKDADCLKQHMILMENSFHSEHFAFCVLKENPCLALVLFGSFEGEGLSDKCTQFW